MITYPNAVDENGDVHNIGTINEKNRSEHKYFCLGCEKEMVPVLFKDKERTSHFRHKVNESCNPETYLHNLAKKYLAKQFTTQRRFDVAYYVRNECPQRESCKIFGRFRYKECFGTTLRTVNLKEIYDTCEIEGIYNGFRADVLLTNSRNPKVEPLFLEVAVSHDCTPEKIESGIRIIEIKVKQEADIIRPIIENTGPLVPNIVNEHRTRFTYEYSPKPEPHFIKFYNFDQARQQNNVKVLDRFSILNDGRMVIQRNCVACGDINTNHLDNSLFEMMVLDRQEVEKRFNRNASGLDLVEFALYHALKCGIPIRYCSYCRNYYGRCRVPVECEQHNYKTGEVEKVTKLIRNILIHDSKVNRNHLALHCKNWSFTGPRYRVPGDYPNGTFFIWRPSIETNK